MHFINQANQFIYNILGSPRFIPDTEYRLSNFIIYTEYENNVFLYNNLTKQLLKLSENEYSDIKLNRCSEKIKETLIRAFFLVPIEADEFKVAQQIKKTVLSLGEKNYINTYTIITTTECNARCWYCYQTGELKIPMSDEIAEKTVRFITENSKGRKVKLSWFGGEPLFNSPAIDRICERLRENNIEFTSFMISNGYLFDNNMISKAKKLWNLKSVQITIDGTEEIYNKSKAYIYKGGSAFNKVIGNIEKLLKSGIGVIVRLNICENNCDDLLALCEWFLNRFDNYTNCRMYLALIKNWGKHELNLSEPSEKLINTYFKILELIYSKHHEEKLNDKIQGNYCMADNSSSAVITPCGGIGKCEHFPNSDFWRTLDDSTENRQLIAEWKKTYIYEECKSCPHFPSCIKLNKCPNRSDSCTQFDRDILNFHIKKHIENLIKNSKNK